ncbi:CARDB domain-containing protein, partial [Nostoc sp. NIES-2111]
TLPLTSNSDIFNSQERSFFPGSTSINPLTAKLASSYIAANESDGDRYANRDNIFTTASTLPDLTGPNASMPSSVVVGNSFQLSYQVQNTGSASAGYSYTDFYLSPDLNIDSTDTYLGYDYVGGIAAGSYSQESATLTIGSNIRPGNYYLIYYMDGDGNVVESNESNNGFGIAFSVTQPDLTAQNAIVPSSATIGNSVQISYQVKNQGTATAGASNTKFYLSQDLNISSNDFYLGFDPVSSILAGNTTQESLTFTVGSNVTPGNYYLIYYVDGDGNVSESNENNNAFGNLITINSAGSPDLLIQNPLSPTSGSLGSTIQLSYGVKNQGVGSAAASTTKFYLSKDGTFSSDDVLLGSDAVNNLAAGASSSETVSLLIANSILPGNYQLLFRADADGNLAESSETNNVVAKAIIINQADLIIQNVSAPSVVDPGSLITVNYQLANQGAASASTSTTKFYLSNDTTLSSDDTLLASDPNYFFSGLSAGTYSSESYYLSLSSNTNFGNYYLLLQADANNDIAESNESNNVTAKAITIAAPDLLIQNPSAPTSANIGTTISLSYQLKNQGNGNAGFHFTNFYISQDQTLSNDDVYLGFDAISSIASSAVASRSTSLTVKSNIIPGNYYLLYKADGDGKIRESNENNNVAARAITITAPDLVIQNATAPSSATIGTTVQVNYELKNQGNGSAGGSKSSFYLSRDTSFGDDDIFLGTEIEANSSIAPSAVISRSTAVALDPIINPGKYYLIVKADGSGSVAESNESNNGFYITAPITFNPVNGGGFNSTTGYGLVNAAAAVAKALGQPTFADVPDLGGDNWGADAIKAPEVWAKGYTGQGVVVAVVDTGIDYNHPDLSPNIWKNTKEISGNGIDDDGNGYIDDVYGWNFVSNNNNPLDLVQGHGTHVAGTIAAVKNSFGVTGIAYNAKVMAVKVLNDEEGSGSNIAIANGIRYAANNGARVINLSLGGSSPQSEILSAIQYAVNKGVIIVSAAGNEGESAPGYPARYANQYGLAVGAVNYNRTLTDFSNRAGTTPLAYVTAPGAYSDYFGIGIYSTYPGNQYEDLPGTSMAAPHVAGVVALMLSAKSSLTDAQVRQILTSTAANGGTLPSQNATSTTSTNTVLSSSSSYTQASISLSSNTTVSNWSSN